MNIHETDGGSITVGLPDWDATRRDLIAMRVKHGADTRIGHRCSNIAELINVSEPPMGLISRQVAELHRLLKLEA